MVAWQDGRMSSPHGFIASPLMSAYPQGHGMAVGGDHGMGIHGMGSVASHPKHDAGTPHAGPHVHVMAPHVTSYVNPQLAIPDFQSNYSNQAFPQQSYYPPVQQQYTSEQQQYPQQQQQQQQQYPSQQQYPAHEGGMGGMWG
jgi:hypothetical protein